MKKIEIKFEEAVEFARENGYLFALYELQETNYLLIDDELADEYIDNNDIIIVRKDESGIYFNEFTTKDKKYLCRLHNNYNLPRIIPIIEKEKKEEKKNNNC